MYQSGMSIPEISKKTNIALSSVRNKLIKFGCQLRSRQEAVRMAFKDGKVPSRKGVKLPPRSNAWCENISKSLIGKGRGFCIKPSGYLEYTSGKNKFRSIHVVVMEEKIGRKLYSNECVHHIDHNKQNNHINNLQLMTRSEHARLHATENILKRKRDEKGRLI